MAKSASIRYLFGLKTLRPQNVRKKALYSVIISGSLLLLLIVGGTFFGNDRLGIDFLAKNQAPSFKHFFGTDWLGRDMFVRTVKGLTLSFFVGLLASFISVTIALFLSLISAFNKMVDQVVTWLIDLNLGIPHLVSLILISFALGGGLKGVVTGVALTHWPSLTRLLRAEVLQLNEREYIGVSRSFGKSRLWIAWHHFTPHLLPQLLVGFILLFPHAILHEASITFLGFGLSSEQPAIGVILSESMNYLSAGMWWLAFFPGIALVFMVWLFETLGRNLRLLADPTHGQRG